MCSVIAYHGPDASGSQNNNYNAWVTECPGATSTGSYRPTRTRAVLLLTTRVQLREADGRGGYSIASLRAPRQHVTEREGGGWWILDCVGWVGSARLKHVDAVEVLGGLHQALGHELLAAAQGHARVVVLLVGLLVAVGVADLALQVRAELGLVRAQAWWGLG